MIGSQDNAARPGGIKAGLKLALLKAGVEIVLRIGSFVQNRGRPKHAFVRSRTPA